MNELELWLEELTKEKDRKLEQRRQYDREWYAKHSEQFKLKNKRYRTKYPRYSKQHSKQYREDNPERVSLITKRWKMNHPEKIKEYNTKRNRGLGFISLNKYFKGSVAHHLDRVYVVYIPKEVHESIPHCLETGEGMEEINKFAIDFIKKEIIELIMK